MTKQMLFFIALVDALPFNTISAEDIQQPGDRIVREKWRRAAQARKTTHNRGTVSKAMREKPVSQQATISDLSVPQSDLLSSNNCHIHVSSS